MNEAIHVFQWYIVPTPHHFIMIMIIWRKKKFSVCMQTLGLLYKEIETRCNHMHGCACPPRLIGKLTSPLFNLCFKNANQRNNKNQTNKWKKRALHFGCIARSYKIQAKNTCNTWFYRVTLLFPRRYGISFMLGIQFSDQFSKQNDQRHALKMWAFIPIHSLLTWISIQVIN